jgi:hypothetical protein
LRTNDPTIPVSPFIHEEQLYFFGRGENGRELQVYDGHSTVEVADLIPGGAWSARLEDIHYAFFDDKVLIEGLYHPFLTEPVYVLHNDQLSLLGDRSFRGLVERGVPFGKYFISGGVVFNPVSGKNEVTLFRTDGQTVVPISLPQPTDGTLHGPDDFTVFNDQVYFEWKGPNGWELFSTNGFNVNEINLEGPQESQAGLASAHIVGDKLMFWVKDGNTNGRSPRLMAPDGEVYAVRLFGDRPTQIYRTFQIADWTHVLAYPERSIADMKMFKTKDFREFIESPYEGLGIDEMDLILETPDGVFFSAEKDIGQNELFWTDGEHVQVFDFVPGYSRPYDLHYWEGALYFGTIDHELYKLVRSDSIARVDYNRNGIVDVGDLDIQAEELRSQSHLGTFDLNGDRRVDLEDRIAFVTGFAKTVIGDSNLDGQFDSTDLVLIFQSTEYEDAFPLNSGWARGDWDGDGDFTTRDLVFALQAGQFEIGEGAIIPEPQSFWQVILTLLLVNSYYGNEHRRLVSKIGRSSSI